MTLTDTDLFDLTRRWTKIRRGQGDGDSLMELLAFARSHMGVDDFDELSPAQMDALLREAEFDPEAEARWSRRKLSR